MQEYVAPILLEAQGAYVVHARCSGHEDQGELELSRELVRRRARMGQPCPSLHWSVEQSLGLMVLV